MSGNLYWICSLVLAITLLIILINYIYTSEKVTRIEKNFRQLVGWVVFFCLQDVFWGFCDSNIIPGDKIFFLSSTIFHISTIITALLWIRYIIAYLGERLKHLYLYIALTVFVVALQFLLVIANFFYPVIFTIQNGKYVTEFLRPLAFLNQYLFYIVICIITFICFLKEKGLDRKNFFSVFLFALIPTLCGIFQLLYPNDPFYSIGYFLGCFIIHIFIVSKDREDAATGTVVKSIADIYYTMHLIDLEKDTLKCYIESKSIRDMRGDSASAQSVLTGVMTATVSEEYLPGVLEFVNLSTLKERMIGKTILSTEFIGRNFGWTRVSFISVERDSNGVQKKVMITTQVIDEEKRKQIDLIFKSYNDELTNLNNRRAYESDIEKYSKDIPENLVYISMDVNELKVINDSMGHVAGDELLIGASMCMKQCFGSYGRVYRTGGDEFSAIIFVSKTQLDTLKQDFEDTINNWKGKFINSISVSCGYVTRKEMPNASLSEISKIADERMYEDKSEFYRKKGIDRRGQRDAHAALCALYTKILKINLTDDSYQIINMDPAEQTKAKGYTKQISTWLKNFGTSGQVHKEDLQEYLEQTDIEYMKNFFSLGNSVLPILYRRKFNDEYKRVIMEIIPANDYSDQNQSLFLYVKTIDK